MHPPLYRDGCFVSFLPFYSAPPLP